MKVFKSYAHLVDETLLAPLLSLLTSQYLSLLYLLLFSSGELESLYLLVLLFLLHWLVFISRSPWFIRGVETAVVFGEFYFYTPTVASGIIFLTELIVLLIKRIPYFIVKSKEEIREIPFPLQTLLKGLIKGVSRNQSMAGVITAALREREPFSDEEMEGLLAFLNVSSSQFWMGEKKFCILNPPHLLVFSASSETIVIYVKGISYTGIEETLCAVCREEMQHPISLECRHSYCLDCVLQWLKSSARIRVSVEGEIREELLFKARCPLCSHEISLIYL